MALKAGRRGLNKRLVDAFGNFNGEVPSGEYYTKSQTDNKFETKTHVNNTFQKKTLDVPIEMLSGSKLTVEDALQGLNEEKFTYADNGVVGAKNLLPNNAISQTKNGITFTVNADGSVTANGTATASTDLIVSRDLPLLYGGRYILSGCPSGGAVSKYRITAYRVDSIDGQSGSLFDIGEGVEFTYKNMTGNAMFIIYIENGVTVDNLTFYPMIRLASDPDGSYSPYAKTNREITEELTVQESAVTDIISGAEVGDLGNYLYKYGKVVTLTLRLNSVTATAFTRLFKIPTDYLPKKTLRILSAVNTALQPIQIQSDTGDVLTVTDLTNSVVLIHASWITD